MSRSSLALLAILATATSSARAEPSPRSVAVQFNLLQPLVLRGGNVEVDLRWGRWVADYSHGWSLHVPTTGTYADQHLRQVVPMSTGAGFGPSLVRTPSLHVDVRAEAKLHRFEFDVATDGGRQEAARYSTATLGGGAYVTWQPFHRRASDVRGLVVGASVRYWPRVWSSLRDDRLTYANPTTGRMEVHDAADIGIANTPLIINASVGYLFAF